MPGVRFEYTYQAELTGLADAIYEAKEFVGKDGFAVVLGDSVIDTDQGVTPLRQSARNV